MPNFTEQTRGIIDLTYSQMRALLTIVPNERLVIFMSVADKDVARKICSSLSKTAAGYLCDDTLIILGGIPDEDIKVTIDYILELAADIRAQAA